MLTTLSAASASSKIPLPDRNPSDFLRYGCDIQQDADTGRWPAAVWIDIRELKPLGPDPDNKETNVADKQMADCQRAHSWCGRDSFYDGRDKAMKSCSRWLKQVQKLLKTGK